MAFRIEITTSAQQDIAETVEFISSDSPERAKKWFEGLFAVLERLRENPVRHALIPEADALQRKLRSIHHHSYRVIFEVAEEQEIVYVVRVYHGARRPLTPKDFT